MAGSLINLLYKRPFRINNDTVISGCNIYIDCARVAVCKCIEPVITLNIIPGNKRNVAIFNIVADRFKYPHKLVTFTLSTYREPADMPLSVIFITINSAHSGV